MVGSIVAWTTLVFTRTQTHACMQLEQYVSMSNATFNSNPGTKEICAEVESQGSELESVIFMCGADVAAAVGKIEERCKGQGAGGNEPGTNTLGPTGAAPSTVLTLPVHASKHEHDHVLN